VRPDRLVGGVAAAHGASDMVRGFLAEVGAPEAELPGQVEPQLGRRTA
jgi:hypothetical protein